MTPRTILGMALAVLTFVLFGYFIHRGCEITGVWGWTFGGAALFCGILIDAEDFKALVAMVRRPAP